MSGGGWKHDRRSRHARGYGKEWQRLRAAALARDHHLCQPCLRGGRITPAREVDHIIPKSQGGADDLDAIQSICTACHAAKTTREGHDARGHKAVRIVGPDGYPIEG